MTVDPVTVSPETTVLEAAHLMRSHKFGGLPVLKTGQLVGIVTEIDLLDYLIELLEANTSQSRRNGEE